MLHQSSNPIGIFDSGMGGLTVAKAITELLPNENIIYFGDTAHSPWGDKSVAAIQSYSTKICDILLQHHCKLIVIACHTASTAAHEILCKHVDNQIPILNVVDPVIQHIGSYHADKKMGLIGTKQTIRSNVYQKRIDTLNRNIELSSLATPLLASLVEEGFANNPISEMAIREYLSHPSLSDVKALILGCTHYPLLKHYIENFYHDVIDIIDASEVTAKALKEHLIKEKMLNSSQSTKRIFYVSDHNEFFAKTAQLFFASEIELQPYPIRE